MKGLINHDDIAKVLISEEQIKQRIAELGAELRKDFANVEGEIVHNIKQKDYQAARAAIAPAGSFDLASHALAGGIDGHGYNYPRDEQEHRYFIQVPGVLDP